MDYHGIYPALACVFLWIFGPAGAAALVSYPSLSLAAMPMPILCWQYPNNPANYGNHPFILLLLAALFWLVVVPSGKG